MPPFFAWSFSPFCYFTCHTINVLCYYAPNADGTLISPNAICAQYQHMFYGYHIYADEGRSRRDCIFGGREGIDDLVMTTYKSNNLWWHTPDSHLLCRPFGNDETVNDDLSANKLSSAATWKLWHQRLGHCGRRTMEIMHNHVIGVPKL